MASAAIDRQQPVNGSSTTRPRNESSDVLEYVKILRLRDEILAGTHPRLKVPGHLVAKSGLKPPQLSTPTGSLRQSEVHRAQVSTTRNPQARTVAMTVSSSDFDPVLLTKSDELIRAELKFQRQRFQSQREGIERDLQNASLKQPDLHPDDDMAIDVADVLAKAMSKLTPAPAPVPDGPASDSFDERSYYSSQQNESSFTDGEGGVDVAADNIKVGRAQGDTDAFKLHTTDLSAGDRPIPVYMGKKADHVEKTVASDKRDEHARSSAKQEFRDQHISLSTPSSSGTGGVSRPATEFYRRVQAGKSAPRTGTSATVLTDDDSIKGTVSDGAALQPGSAQDKLSQLSSRKSPPAGRQSPEIPIYRNHIRSPAAPQPARVSPLAVARLPPEPREPPSLPSLPPHSDKHYLRRESPPPIVNPRKRRRAIEKPKAKADSPEPYIKPEPTSESPPIFSVPEIPPSKKRREHRPRDIDVHEGRGPTHRPRISSGNEHTPRYRRYERHEPETPSTGGGLSHLRSPSPGASGPGHGRYEPHGQVSAGARFAEAAHSPLYDPRIRGQSPLYEVPARMASRNIHPTYAGEERRYVAEHPEAVQPRYVRVDRSHSPVRVHARPDRPSFMMAPPPYPGADPRVRYYAAPPAQTRMVSRQPSMPVGRRLSGSVPAGEYEHVRMLPYTVASDRDPYHDGPSPTYIAMPAPGRRAVSRAMYDPHPRIVSADATTTPYPPRRDYSVVRPLAAEEDRYREMSQRPVSYARPASHQIIDDRDGQQVSHQQPSGPSPLEPMRSGSRMPSVRYERPPPVDYAPARVGSIRPESALSSGYAVRQPTAPRREYSVGVDVGRDGIRREYLPAEQERVSYLPPASMRESDRRASAYPGGGRRYVEVEAEDEADTELARSYDARGRRTSGGPREVVMVQDASPYGRGYRYAVQSRDGDVEMDVGGGMRRRYPD